MPILMQAIEELPGQESPEIFGLHPNADLTFRTLQVQAAVQIIMDTQPKGAGGGGGLSREEIVDRICEDLLSKVSLVIFVTWAREYKSRYRTLCHLKPHTMSSSPSMLTNVLQLICHTWIMLPMFSAPCVFFTDQSV